MTLALTAPAFSPRNGEMFPSLWIRSPVSRSSWARDTAGGMARNVGRHLGQVGSVAAATFSLLGGGPCFADDAIPTELQGIGIEENPGATPPKELVFLDHQGNSVKLGDYFDGKSPVILVLAYYRCPMLCSMVLGGLTDGLKDLAWNVGD